MGAPQPAKPRVFLSYSRKDSTFVDELVISVESYGFEVVFDRADLFPGEPWEPRLQRLITDAETTVCVVSRNWIASEQCVKELDIAFRQGRRVVPVIIDPVNPSEMPADLARLQFVFFHGAGHSYARGVVSLVETLRTDIGWVREQSRLLDKADEWAAQGKSSAALLRGPALDRALTWLGSPAPRDTRILPLVTEFIEASRKGQSDEEKKRLRSQRNFTIVALAACIFGLIGTGAVGYIVYDRWQATGVELEVAKVDLSETKEINQRYQETPEPTKALPIEIPPDLIDRGLDADVAPPAALLKQLVADLDSTDRDRRLAAGQKISDLVRAGPNPDLQGLLAAELQLPRFELLSPAGRVNVLYMLNAHAVWTPEEGAKSMTALTAIEQKSTTDKSFILGSQARDCIATLKRRIAGEQAAGCGG